MRYSVKRFDDGQGIEGLEIQYSPASALRISRKISARDDKEIMIDLRRWSRYSDNNNEGKISFVPTRKGVYISEKIVKNQLVPVLLYLCGLSDEEPVGIDCTGERVSEEPEASDE